MILTLSVLAVLLIIVVLNQNHNITKLWSRVARISTQWDSVRVPQSLWGGNQRLIGGEDLANAVGPITADLKLLMDHLNLHITGPDATPRRVERRKKLSKKQQEMLRKSLFSSGNACAGR